MESKNIRMEKFAKYYSASGNAYKSAIKAGYSEKYAKANSFKLLEKIGQRIKKDCAKENRLIGLTREKKKAKLESIVNNPESDINAILKAIDIDNRMDGEYIDKKQISGDVNATIRYTWDIGSDKNGTG